MSSAGVPHGCRIIEKSAQGLMASCAALIAIGIADKKTEIAMWLAAVAPAMAMVLFFLSGLVDTAA